MTDNETNINQSPNDVDDNNYRSHYGDLQLYTIYIYTRL